jgi:hypothetical protein
MLPGFGGESQFSLAVSISLIVRYLAPESKSFVPIFSRMSAQVRTHSSLIYDVVCAKCLFSLLHNGQTS